MDNILHYKYRITNMPISELYTKTAILSISVLYSSQTPILSFYLSISEHIKLLYCSFEGNRTLTPLSGPQSLSLMRTTYFATKPFLLVPPLRFERRIYSPKEYVLPIILQRNSTETLNHNITWKYVSNI